jgi:hypothetical protein
MSDLNFALFRNWESRAWNDSEAARLLLEHNGPTGMVCFCAQQMAEKYFKAFALLHDGPLKRTHNLGLLLKDCADWIPVLGNWPTTPNSCLSTTSRHAILMISRKT